MAEQIRNIIAAGERTKRDVFFQAAGGLLEEVFTFHRHGYDPTPSTVTWKTVWGLADSYPRVLTAGKIELVSSDLDDNAAGDGARKILMTGCDSSGDPLMDIVELDGLTPVQTHYDFFWMDFAHVIDAGVPYGGAQGIITFTHKGTVVLGDNPLISIIEPGINRTQTPCVVIPREYSGYILDHAGAISFNKAARYGWRISTQDNVQQIAFTNVVSGGGPNQLTMVSPERVHFPSLVEMVALADGGGSVISGEFTILVVSDKYDFSIPEDMFSWTNLEKLEFLKAHPSLISVVGAGVVGH